MLGIAPQSDVEIVAPDGTVRHTTKAVVTAKSIIIGDTSIVIEPGDEIRRRIPSGAQEIFEVIDPVFYQNFHGIAAHYQVKVQRKGSPQYKRDHSHNIQINAPHARVNINSRDQSTNVVTHGDVFGDIGATLQGAVKDADELQRLLSAVEEMKQQRGGSGFAAAHQKFMSIATDYMGLIAPYLPALSQLL